MAEVLVLILTAVLLVRGCIWGLWGLSPILHNIFQNTNLGFSIGGVASGMLLNDPATMLFGFLAWGLFLADIPREPKPE